MRHFLLLLTFVFGLLIPTKANASSLWVGETMKCDATSAVMGLTSDVNWSVSGAYVSLSGSGFSRTAQVTQYFSGTVTVKCTWKYRLYSSDTPKTQSRIWEISCLDNPVSISPTRLELKVGQTGQVRYSHQVSNSYTSYASAYFSSSSSCVSVTRDGQITALSPGTAYVNVHSKISSSSPYCIVTIKEGSTPPVNPDQGDSEYEIVDLGLSMNWAHKNIGAEDEYDLGYYFLWGEVTPCTEWYVPYSQYLNIETFSNYYDGTYNLPVSMDAANYYLGNDWRMPTKKDFQELIDKCEWETYRMNGISGYKVTGPSGKCIYLPGDQRHNFYNLYWSNSTPSRASQYSIDYDRYGYALLVSSDQYAVNTCTRIDSCPIRAVTKKKTASNPVPNTIKLSESSLELYEGDSSTMTATITGDNSSVCNWSCSNTSVLSISANGKSAAITAKREGAATVTATAYDGTKATCSVTVKKKDTEIVATSLKDFYKKGRGESRSVTADFTLVVTYEDKSTNYVVDSEGTAGFIYCTEGFEPYKENDLIPKGWKGKLFVSGGRPVIYPVYLPASSGKGTFTPRSCELSEITSDMVNEVVIIKNVTFNQGTPSLDEEVKGESLDGSSSIDFYNCFGAPWFPAGTYDVKCVIFYYDIAGLCAWPIEYHRSSIPSDKEDCIYVIRSSNNYDFGDGTQKLYAKTENGVKTYQGYVDIPEGKQYFLFATELNSSASKYGFCDKWKENTVDNVGDILIMTFPPGTLEKGNSTSLGWEDFKKTDVFMKVNIDDGSLVLIIGQTCGTQDASVAPEDDSTTEYYNLQGVKVDNPNPGLYIQKTGNTVKKVIIR